MERKDYLVVSRSSVLPHYLYQWDVFGMWPRPHWLTSKKLAKRFTLRDARRIAECINANLAPGMGPLCGAYIERLSGVEGRDRIA